MQKRNLLRKQNVASIAWSSLMDCGRLPDMAVQLRAALAADRGALRAFLERLSPATVQLRYLRPAGKLQDSVADLELNRILNGSPSDHVVVLAVDGETVRGVGEFIREQQQVGQAELALVVEDAFQGHGIGRA